MRARSAYHRYNGFDYAMGCFVAAVWSIVSIVLVGALLFFAMTTRIEARDFSDSSLTPQQQYERDQWFSRQKMPDNPNFSCCGQGDAYYADGVYVDDTGTVFAIITDDRPDAPLGRPNIKVGTRIMVPPWKNKDTRNDPNPTGHTIIFVRWYDEAPDYGNWGVLCYLPDGGL